MRLANPPRPTCLIPFGLLVSCFLSSLGSAEEPGVGFHSLLAGSRKALLTEIDSYTRTHPDAADREEAYRWLFTQAREHRLEPLVNEAAGRYLDSDGQELETARIAQQIQLLASARNGGLEQSVAALRTALKGVSLRQPDAAVEFAFDLVAEAQLQRDPLAVRAILDQTANSFFLNQFVRQSCENRLRKVGLLDKPAPPIDLDDMTGKPVQLADMTEKVVLIDFWATNCPPCLAEMPRLKRLYRTHRNRGFEIIGVSLDSDAETVRNYTSKNDINWRIAIHGPAEGGIRNRYSVDTIPSTFLLDRKGQVIAVDLRGVNLERGIEAELDR